MKDFLKKRAKWCDKSINEYNQYFDSRVASYGFGHLGVDASFKLLLSKYDVNSTDLMYYACYNECNGQLALIGSLVNKVGE